MRYAEISHTKGHWENRKGAKHSHSTEHLWDSGVGVGGTRRYHTKHDFTI